MKRAFPLNRGKASYYDFDDYAGSLLSQVEYKHITCFCTKEQKKRNQRDGIMGGVFIEN